jgi:CBS domain-containing protein
MILASILKHKGHTVIAVPPETPVPEVLSILRRHRIGAVLVMDAARRPLGILSERDIVFALAEKGAAVLEMTAEALMTPDPVTAHPATTLEEAMQMMTDGRFRHIPVVDEDGRVVGLVSIGDVVKARLAETEQEMGSLMAYVAGAV